MNNENLETKVTILPPFKRFCMTIGELPTSYIDSMTYYESLVWLCNYLSQTVIPAVNNNGEAVTELQEKYIELKDYVDNYFENLDIQTEIDNKLDDMAESGELAEIIAAYLEVKSVLAFDTIADLKDAENIIDGSVCRTLGYNDVNDGGDGLYLIRQKTLSDTVDEGSIVEITESLIAELINSKVYLEQFGAAGDGTSDDTEEIENAITYAKATGKQLTCGTGKTFCVSDQLDISALNVDFNNSTFKAVNEITSIFVINSNNKGYFVKNINFDCNSLATSGLLITNARTLHLTNMTFRNILSYGIKVDSGYEIIIEHIFMTTLNTASIGIELNTADCNINDVIMTDVQIAFRLTRGSNTFNNIHCWIGSTSKINDSYMFKLALAAEGTIHMNDVYNDTYRYFIFNENNVTSFIYIDNFETQYNTGIYTSEKENSYIVYANTDNQTYYVNFSNSFIKGLGANSELQHTELTNRSSFYGFINHSDINAVITKLDFELTNIDARFTTLANNITKNDGVITINFLASYDASSVSGMVNPVAKIPWWLLPSNNILSYCQVTDSRWDYTTSTFTYMFIDVPNEKIQVKIPTGETGTKYLHINLTYTNRSVK